MGKIVNIDGTDRDDGYTISSGYRWRLDGTSGEGYYYPKDGDQSLELIASFNSKGVIKNIKIKHDQIFKVKGQFSPDPQWMVELDQKCAEVFFELIDYIRNSNGL